MNLRAGQCIITALHAVFWKGCGFMAVFLGNAIALLLVALLVAVCVRELIQGHKSGGCSGGCAGCSGGCAGCRRSRSCSSASMRAGTQKKGGEQL